MAQLWAEELPDSPLAETNDEFAVTCGHSTLYLDRVHLQCQQEPERQEEIIRAWCRKSASALEPAEPDAENAVPIIRTQAWLDEMPWEVWGRPLGEGLYLILALDFEKVTAIKERAWFEDRGITEWDAFMNLIRMKGQPATLIGEGVFYLELDGAYESSLLLTGYLENSEERPFPGQPVFAIPTPGSFAFADSTDPAAVDRLKSFGEDAFDSAGINLCRSLLVKSGDGVMLYRG